MEHHIHDAIGKTLLLVEPLGHVIDRRSKKHPRTDAVKRSKTNDQLNWLLVSSQRCTLWLLEDQTHSSRKSTPEG